MTPDYMHGIFKMKIQDFISLEQIYNGRLGHIEKVISIKTNKKMPTVSSKRGSLHPCTCDMGAFQLPPSSLVVTVVIFVEFEKVCHPSKLYFQSS